jgi:putative FmdB family regulatory protein
MPTYEYVCDACGHAFDELQSFSDEPLKKCPQCGKNKLRRLFGTGAAVLFKGSGFYQTDYRSESYKSGEKKEGEASKPAAESKPAESKPAETKATESKPADTGSSAKPSRSDRGKK